MTKWVFPYNYHYLYILESGKEAYIGETNDIIRRNKEHHKPSDVCYEYHFKYIHVITGYSIEETPAKHYETLLIKLMDADQKFHVINPKDGLPGLDLNYAAVVIGPDVYYDTVDGKIKVDKAHYYDDKVKRGSTDDEIKKYVLNTYAVFLTRGIYGTYLYVCDEALREYLQKYIPGHE